MCGLRRSQSQIYSKNIALGGACRRDEVPQRRETGGEGMKKANDLAIEIGVAMTHPDAPVCGPRELAEKIRAIQADALEAAAKKADASGSPNDPWCDARRHIANDIRDMKPKEKP